MTGRVVLVVSPLASPEPRLQVALEAPLRTPYIFGQAVEALKPGSTVEIDRQARGWPLAALSALPTGEYTVQAVLNRYETFHDPTGAA